MNIVSKQELIEFPEDQAKAGETAQSARTLGEQPISGEVLLEKYAKGDESSAREVHARVAHALAQCEAEDQRALWQERFTHALEAGFVPAGRINSAAGTSEYSRSNSCATCKTLIGCTSATSASA